MPVSYDLVTLVAAGITLHESLKAQQFLEQQGVKVRVIDLYSLKPLDEATLKQAAKETQAILRLKIIIQKEALGEAVR